MLSFLQSLMACTDILQLLVFQFYVPPHIATSLPFRPSSTPSDPTSSLPTSPRQLTQETWGSLSLSRCNVAAVSSPFLASHHTHIQLPLTKVAQCQQICIHLCKLSVRSKWLSFTLGFRLMWSQTVVGISKCAEGICLITSACQVGYSTVGKFTVCLYSKVPFSETKIIVKSLLLLALIYVREVSGIV